MGGGSDMNTQSHKNLDMMVQPLRDGASTGRKFATEDHEYDPNTKLIELSEETEDKHTDLP